MTRKLQLLTTLALALCLTLGTAPPAAAAPATDDGAGVLACLADTWLADTWLADAWHSLVSVTGELRPERIGIGGPDTPEEDADGDDGVTLDDGDGDELRPERIGIG